MWSLCDYCEACGLRIEICTTCLINAGNYGLDAEMRDSGEMSGCEYEMRQKNLICCVRLRLSSTAACKKAGSAVAAGADNPLKNEVQLAPIPSPALPTPHRICQRQAGTLPFSCRCAAIMSG